MLVLPVFLTVTLDHEDLADVGKIEIVVEISGYPDNPFFDSSVPKIDIFPEVGFAPVLEEKFGQPIPTLPWRQGLPTASIALRVWTPPLMQAMGRIINSF